MTARLHWIRYLPGVTDSFTGGEPGTLTPARAYTALHWEQLSAQLDELREERRRTAAIVHQLERELTATSTALLTRARCHWDATQIEQAMHAATAARS